MDDARWRDTVVAGEAEFKNKRRFAGFMQRTRWVCPCSEQRSLSCPDRCSLSCSDPRLCRTLYATVIPEGLCRVGLEAVVYGHVRFRPLIVLGHVVHCISADAGVMAIGVLIGV